MRLRILGPLEILDVNGAQVLVSGAKRRALLAALVVRAGQTVSMDRLIQELWGEHPPANATNALQAHIRRLRAMLRSAAGDDDRILTRAPGYLLALRPGETDADAFADTVARARSLAKTEPHRAIPLLRSALALWRGAALDGCVAGAGETGAGAICAAEIAVLEEHRLGALELLYDACLRTGQHGEVIGELEELTVTYPLRERFYDQLMVAMYRCDRQSDAIGVYERARRRLQAELGVQPGPALRARMRDIRTTPSAGATRLPTQPTQHDDPYRESAELSRELAALRQRINTLANRQEELLRSLSAMR